MDLRTRLHAFEHERQTLLDVLSQLGDERLTARPIPEKWTLLEIVEHLAIAERSVYQGLPDYAALAARSRTNGDRIRGAIVRTILTLGIPVRVPAAEMLPTGGRSFAEVRAHWDENQRWLQGWIASAATSGRLGARVFSHPVAGPLDTRDAITLGTAHLRTHQRQIRRLERMLRPAS